MILWLQKLVYALSKVVGFFWWPSPDSFHWKCLLSMLGLAPNSDYFLTYSLSPDPYTVAVVRIKHESLGDSQRRPEKAFPSIILLTFHTNIKNEI